MRKTTLTLTLAATIFSAGLTATPANSTKDKPAIQPQQTYRSCSLITSELLTSLQFYRQGIGLDQLKQSLAKEQSQSFAHIREVYVKAKQAGALKLFEDINTDYQRCAQQVYDLRNKPNARNSEFGFYFCAGENKLRHQILQSYAAKESLESLTPKLPESRRNVATSLYEVARQEGLEQAYDSSAQELKHCLNGALGLSQQDSGTGN